MALENPEAYGRLLQDIQREMMGMGAPMPTASMKLRQGPSVGPQAQGFQPAPAQGGGGGGGGGVEQVAEAVRRARAGEIGWGEADALMAQLGVSPDDPALAAILGGEGEAAQPAEDAPAEPTEAEQRFSARQDKRWGSVKELFAPETREPSARNKALRDGAEQGHQARSSPDEQRAREGRGRESAAPAERPETAGERAAKKRAPIVAEGEAREAKAAQVKAAAQPKAVKDGNVWRIEKDGVKSSQSWPSQEEAEAEIEREAERLKRREERKARRPR
jgi:hypothetical protein